MINAVVLFLFYPTKNIRLEKSSQFSLLLCNEHHCLVVLLWTFILVKAWFLNFCVPVFSRTHFNVNTEHLEEKETADVNILVLFNKDVQCCISAAV